MAEVTGWTTPAVGTKLTHLRSRKVATVTRIQYAESSDPIVTVQYSATHGDARYYVSELGDHFTTLSLG
ncbi:hypothetical protein, partial [Klebsiella pneumoniae]|uniref:hypothetical protein n=1 Tax=Klebsiella pneumoniae TaxID=573 RepID=UPI0025A0F3F8